MTLEPLAMTFPSRIGLAVPVGTTEHAIGLEHAPVTIVEYGDFQCLNCKQAAPVIKLLLGRFAEQVRFVYRHFPLETLHPHALRAAEAAECAGAQGRFWPMHETLFAHQDRLYEKDLHQYAAQLGLDLVRYEAEMHDEAYLPRIREHIAGGLRSHLRSTPGFFVNGVIVDVSFDLRALFDATAAAIART